ncbi:hypothetical protein EPN96_02330 [bacterium]|nr:MAG: hypothetical protein EPN96_02330 [bacterium]
MHIVKKILDEVGRKLKSKYSVYVNPDELKQLQEPLEFEEGKLCRGKFEKRQETSIDIIEKILDIHGKGDIVKFLGKLAKIEPKIQDLQPWVRDHVVHAINTFLLGVYFLETVDFPTPEQSRFDYPFMWKLCGPTHDLGYPVEIAKNIDVQFTNELNDIIRKSGAPSPQVTSDLLPTNLNMLCGGRDSNALIQQRLREWGLDIDIDDYYNWLNNQNKTDHGVISALAQLKVVDAIYCANNPNRKTEDVVSNDFNYNQTNFDLDIVSASSALFIHNIESSYAGFKQKISFELAPLAFLLFLCDTLQEWDRYAENRPVYSGEDFNLACTSNSISMYIPKDIEKKVSSMLSNRLEGLTIYINGNVVVK